MCHYGNKDCRDTSDHEHACRTTPVGYARAAMADIVTRNPTLSTIEAQEREACSLVFIADFRGQGITLTADQVHALAPRLCKAKVVR